MTETDRPRFLRAFSALCVAFRQDDTGPMLRVYWEALKDLDVERIERASVAAVQECQFFPPVAVLREYVASMPGPQWQAPKMLTAGAPVDTSDLIPVEGIARRCREAFDRFLTMRKDGMAFEEAVALLEEGLRASIPVKTAAYEACARCDDSGWEPVDRWVPLYQEMRQAVVPCACSKGQQARPGWERHVEEVRTGHYPAPVGGTKPHRSREAS